MVKALPSSLQSNRTRRRVGSQGASRKQAPVQPSKLGFAWLNRILILAGGGVVLVAGLQALVALQSIPVEQITVTGKLEYTRAEEVQELVQPVLVGGFLSADLVLIRQQLESMPWIYRATVRRRWPSSLELNVVEQVHDLTKISFIQEEWKKGEFPYVHGWVYSLKDGLIKDLNVTSNSLEGLGKVFKYNH